MHPVPSTTAPPRRRRRAGLVAVALAAAALLTTYVVAVTGSANAADSLLSQGKPATASSTENAGTPAANAVDGNTGTRWSSAFSDPQWIQVDLGATATISQVILNWETAYATAYQIQTSSNGTTWTTVYNTTTSTGGVQTLTVSGSGRYVRMNGTARATQWGYSLWEFQVYGSFATIPTTPPPSSTVPTGCGTVNAALGRPATASSQENDGTAAANAFDGNTGTRWSSTFSDPQWIQVDLGSPVPICQVVLQWEAAYATAYQIQLSTNGTAWTNAYSTTTSTGGTQTLTVTGTARYLRVNGTARATQYGYSLWEVTVRTVG